MNPGGTNHPLDFSGTSCKGFSGLRFEVKYCEGFCGGLPFRRPAAKSAKLGAKYCPECAPKIAHESRAERSVWRAPAARDHWNREMARLRA